MPGPWHNIHVAIITEIVAPAVVTKRKAYTVTTKLQAVEVAEKTSKAARPFAVDPRRIHEWCAQKHALEKMKKLRQLDGGG